MDKLIGSIFYDGNKDFYLNNIGNFLLNNEYNITRLNNLENILEKFRYLEFQIGYSSKYINIDEFSGKKYLDIKSSDNENENNEETNKKFKYVQDELISKKIIGSNTFFFFPRGIILFHPRNQLLYDCFQYQFHFNKKSIPLQYTNLSELKKYRVRRSDGCIHDAIINYNNSIRFNESKKYYIIEMHFNNDTKNITFKSDVCDYIKSVSLKEFVELNNINNLEIRFPLINDNNYDLNNLDVRKELAEELIKYYNYEIKKYENYLNREIKINI